MNNLNSSDFKYLLERYWIRWGMEVDQTDDTTYTDPDYDAADDPGSSLNDDRVDDQQLTIPGL